MNGIAIQSEIGLIQTKNLVARQQSYREKLGAKRVPEAAQRLIEHVFVNPIIHPPSLAKEWGMSFQTLSLGIERLVKLGLLMEMSGQKRNRYFRAAGVLEAIENASNLEQRL